MEASDVQPDVESRGSSPDFNTLYFFKRSIGESTESMYSRSESMYSRGDSRDVWWSDVNYSVGETKILKGCWGHVSDNLGPAILFLPSERNFYFY